MSVNKQDITTRKPALGERLSMWLIPLVLTLIQRVYGLSFRRIDLGKEHVEKLRHEGKPWIYGLWHTNVLFLGYLLRHQFSGLVSNSKDGELITRVLRYFGNGAIRGSSSKGGVQALRGVIKALKEGVSIAITPDGPRGPALEVKDGIVHAARASGAPIIPFYYAATRQWVLEKAWDRHIIPKPFSTLVVSFGPPIDVKKLSENRSDEELIEEVKKQLLENIERCHSEIRKRQNSQMPVFQEN